MTKRIAISVFIFFLFLSCSNLWAEPDSSAATVLSKEEVRKEYVITQLKSIFSDKKALQKSGLAASTKPTREVTLLLREAAINFDSYDAETQQYLSTFLMRPDESTNNWPWDGEPDFYLDSPVPFEPDAGTYPAISGKFVFWYVTNDTTVDDGVDHSATLSFVQSMAAAFETVYSTTHTTMGYPAPPDDSAISPNGGDSRMDIYVMDCGHYSVYGYTGSEGSGSSKTSFMVMDNDFLEFVTPSQTAEESMQVTAAHEYHHAVQFGINSGADAWIMEATATWMEDQIYDSIDDNLQYLNDGANSFFKNPDLSLDLSQDPFWYGKWIWLEYMETKWDQAAIKNIWLDYLINSNSGVNAVSKVLLDKSSDLKNAFTEFATWNYVQSTLDGLTLYGDASAYDPVYIANAASSVGFNLDYTSASSDTFTQQNFTINHLAAKYFKLTPGASISSEQSDTLTVYVNGTDNRRIDVVPVVKSTGGAYSAVTLSLDASNYGKIEITGFNRSDISEIVLVLVNYSPDEDSSVIAISGGIGSDGADNTISIEPVSPPATTGSGGGGCFIQSIE